MTEPQKQTIFKPEDIKAVATPDTPIPDTLCVMIVNDTAYHQSRQDPSKFSWKIEAEVLEPAAVEVPGGFTEDGQARPSITTSLAGRKYYGYCSVKPTADYGLPAIFNGLASAEFDFDKFHADGGIDVEHPECLKGLTFTALMRTKLEYATNAVTGAVLTDAKGRPIVKRQDLVPSRGISIFQSIIGPADVKMDTPY